jgi:tetratricopeptide (TPR) repeat protein
LLWESFHQATPDISVNFEMSVSGYLNPVEAKMTIDYEKVHKTMQAQVAARYGFFAAEVDALVQSMRDNGAITVELTGAPPSQWDAIQKMGLELARNHLFENQGGTGLASLAAMQQKSSPMDQMWKRYGDEWKKKASHLQWPPDALTQPAWLSGHPLTAGALLGAAISISPQESIEQKSVVMENPSASPVPDADLEKAKKAFVEAQQLYVAKKYVEAATLFKSAYEYVPTPAFLFNAAVAYTKAGEAEPALAHFDIYVNNFPRVENNIGVVQTQDAAKMALSEGATSEKMTPLLEAYSKAILAAEEAIKKAAPKSATPGTSPGTTPKSPTAGETSKVTPKAPAATGSPTGELKSPTITGAAKASTTAGTPKTPTKKATAKTPAKKVTPKVSPTAKPKAGSETPYGVMVSFKYRRLERTGKFTLNFKQWLRTQRPVRFAENLGDLTGWLDEPSVFRRVNLDDPVFRQREIPVSVDVAGEEAFAAMLNAVTVQLRKVHGSGRETVDEVTIQRQDFASGLPPTLLYGWDGDDNRERWLEYDYRVRWNYVGGPEIQGDWQQTSAGAQVLAPPLRPRELILEADPGFLEEQGVRDVVVEVSYDAAGTERRAHATVRTRAETGEQRLVLYQDPQVPDYRYSFTWRLRGGQRVSAGPFTDTADYVYLDEIPRE